MTEAVKTQTQACNLELAAATCWWCACRRCKTQPFCDDSHKGTDFTPVDLVIEDKQPVWICGCRRSDDNPMCNDTHNELA